MKFLIFSTAVDAASLNQGLTRSEPIVASLNHPTESDASGFMGRQLQDYTPQNKQCETVADCAKNAEDDCVDGWCVHKEKCSNIKYNPPNNVSKDCTQFDLGENNPEGVKDAFYRNMTIVGGSNKGFPKGYCFFYRFYPCSEVDIAFKEDPSNCSYEYKEWGACDYWQTQEGADIGYARNRAVKDYKRDDPYNLNGQTCWTEGSVPNPTDYTEENDDFWRNESTGNCVLDNKISGCGVTWHEWDAWACRRWSGFDDIYPEEEINLDDGTRLYARIRGFNITDGKAGEQLETGEVCEAWDETARNIIRKDGLSVEKCADPKTVCPLEGTPEVGEEKPGCCEYTYSETWSECKDGKKFKGIDTVVRSGSRVHCLQPVSQADIHETTGLKDHAIWQGKTWDSC